MVIIGSLVILLLMGIPVAFGFLLVNFAGIFYLMGAVGFEQLILSIFSSLTKFTLAPVPLFILMGTVIFHSGMALPILDAIDKWLGRVPGRLSIMAVASGAIFANLTGSTLANTALLGTLLVPQMKQRGYKNPMILGPILGTGGLAMIIPPSALAVILGSIAGISIGQLLIAGIIPGFLMASLYGVYIIGRCYLQPHLAPVYEMPPVSFSEKIKSFILYVLPLSSIIFMVLGTIFLGIATPTEAAALGALCAFVLAVLYRKLNIHVIEKSIMGCLEITVMAFMIIAGSIAFSQVLAFSGVSRNLIHFVTRLDMAPIMILIAMQLIILFLGTFMEQISIMMITLPIYMPIVNVLGFNPVWFGILMLLNLEIALTTPPFGMLLFVMKGVSSRDTAMVSIYSAAIPFILCDIIAMALIFAFPAIVTFLPDLML